MAIFRRRFDEVVFANLISQELKRVYKPAELKKFRLKDIFSIPNPRQGKWIEAGGFDEVFRFPLPKGKVLFITAIGLAPVRKGDYYFYKGSQLVDTPNSTRVYGTIENPTVFDIGMNVSYEDIIFKGKNDDDQKAYFEVLCRGFYIDKDLVDELFAMLGRTGVEVVP